MTLTKENTQCNQILVNASRQFSDNEYIHIAKLNLSEYIVNHFKTKGYCYEGETYNNRTVLDLFVDDQLIIIGKRLASGIHYFKWRSPKAVEQDLCYVDNPIDLALVLSQQMNNEIAWIKHYSQGIEQSVIRSERINSLVINQSEGKVKLVDFNADQIIGVYPNLHCGGNITDYAKKPQLTGLITTSLANVKLPCESNMKDDIELDDIDIDIDIDIELDDIDLNVA